MLSEKALANLERLAGAPDKRQAYLEGLLSGFIVPGSVRIVDGERPTPFEGSQLIHNPDFTAVKPDGIYEHGHYTEIVARGSVKSEPGRILFAQCRDQSHSDCPGVSGSIARSETWAQCWCDCHQAGAPDPEVEEQSAEERVKTMDARIQKFIAVDASLGSASVASQAARRAKKAERRKHLDTTFPEALAEILCGDDLDGEAIARDQERMERETKKAARSGSTSAVLGALPKPKDALPAPLLLEDPVTCIHPAKNRINNGKCTACGGRWK